MKANLKDRLNAIIANPDPRIIDLRKMRDNDISDEDRLRIEEILGEPVVSKHNQHAIVIIVGKTGQGKSRAGLFIGYRIAKYIAEHCGGTWQDYFSAENIAVITKEEVIRVMKLNAPKKVIMLDDIGVAWNARDWQDKGNKIMNKIVMTFRNKNNLLILTLPDSFILDKTPRNLLHFHIEMYKQFYDYGKSIFKIFSVVKLYRADKTLYVRPRKNGVQYAGGVVDSNEIPVELIENYESRRAAIQIDMEKDDLAEFEELANSVPKDSRTKKQEKNVLMSMLSQKTIDYIQSEGGKERAFKRAVRELYEETGFKCTYRSLQNYWKKNDVNTTI